jgi:hypothetical protein
VAPKITTSGKTISFRPNGDVALLDNGQEAVHGSWRGRAENGEPKQNRWRYVLDGIDQPPLTPLYAFTDTNQLQVTLVAGDGRSEPALLVGGVEIDDQHDIIYRLANDDATPTGQAVVLYGDLSIERDTNSLAVALEGGGQALVTGSSGIASLEAAQNRIAAFAADDLLRFRASTLNDLDAGGTLEIPAKLDFAGSWDVQNGQLVFLSKVVGDLSHPDVSIGFSGKLGAVTAGFVYFADAAGTQAAFTIRGQHVWHSSGADTTFNWQSSLGFSDKKFAADVRFDASRVAQNGNRLGLKGDLTLKQGDGGTVAMGFSLEAEYAWENNALVFKALVNNTAGGFNYDLMLEGNLKADHGTLTFSIRFTNTPGAEGLTIGLNLAGDQNSAIQAISLQLKISEGSVKLAFEGRFSVKQRFVAGVGRVLEAGAQPANIG